MADYKERFEKWQREAKERFDDFDKQIGLKEKIAEGAKAAKETAETFREGTKKIRTEAEKSEVAKQAVKVAEETFKTAEKVAGETVKTAGEQAKKAWEASEPIRNAAGDAGGKAADAFGESAVEAEDLIKTVGRRAGEAVAFAGETAGKVFNEASETFGATAKKVSRTFGIGASWTRTINSAFKSVQSAGDWIQEKPVQAATTGVSMAVGAGLGVVVTSISSHWFFNSTLPTTIVRIGGEQFKKHLDKQNDLIKKGDLTQAEAERIQFERDIAKFVGAPLLGAYSFTSGVMLLSNVLNPKTVTGAPIDWLLGENPLLEGIWFFGNGIACFQTSYDFFMFALEDQQDVQNVVKEIKGLLPQMRTAQTGEA